MEPEVQDLPQTETTPEEVAEQSPQVEQTEDENEEVETPEDEPEAEPETSEPPATEEVQDAVEATPEPIVDPATAEFEELYRTMQEAQIPEIAPFDISKVPTDENGNIDPAAFNQAVTQSMQSMIANALVTQQLQGKVTDLEKREWTAATDKYPQLKDPEIREMVHAMRNNSIVQAGGNKYLSPVKAADKLFGKLGAAKQDGINAAKRTTRIEQAAHLETGSTRTSPETAKTADLQTRMASSNREEARTARREYIKQLMKSGDIQVSR